MLSKKYKQLCDSVAKAAEEELLGCFKQIGAGIKSDGSMVTAADLAMQQRIQEVLSDNYPDCGFLSEEMSAEEQEKALAAPDSGVWVLDPLDGTSNFAMGIPYFAVSLSPAGLSVSVGAHINRAVNFVDDVASTDAYFVDNANYPTLLYVIGSKPSEAQINIRVHKKTEKVVVRERSPWLYGGIGFGLGYLWGGWWPYPPVIIDPPPPPGEIWPPEEVPPVAIPLPEDPSFADWASENPDIVESYLGEIHMPAEPLSSEQPPAEISSATAAQPLEPEPEPEVSIQSAPAPEPMDVPEPMDMPMDLGDFD